MSRYSWSQKQSADEKAGSRRSGSDEIWLTQGLADRLHREIRTTCCGRSAVAESRRRRSVRRLVLPVGVRLSERPLGFDKKLAKPP